MFDCKISAFLTDTVAVLIDGVGNVVVCVFLAVTIILVVQVRIG